MQASEFYYYVGGLVLLVVLGKFVVNWHHEIGTRNRLMKAQVTLLIELCRKQNVDESILQEVEKKTAKLLTE